jgi:hypothetical protein
MRRGTIIISALAAAAVLAGCSSSTEPKATDTPPSPPAAVATTSSPTSDPGDITTDETKAPTQREQFEAWWADAEEPLGQLGNNVGAIGDLLDSDPVGVMMDPSEVLGITDEARDHVAELQKLGPVPIPEVEEPFGKALTTYGRVFDLLDTGLRSGDTASLLEASSELETATGYVNDASDAITAALG